MKEELAKVLSELGTEGITAFYVYLVVDYVTLWIFLGFFGYGLKCVWNHIKKCL